MPMVGRGDFAAAACFVMAALYACGRPLTTGEWPAESPSNRHLVVRAGVAEGGEALLRRGRPRGLTGCRTTGRLARHEPAPAPPEVRLHERGAGRSRSRRPGRPGAGGGRGDGK